MNSLVHGFCTCAQDLFLFKLFHSCCFIAVIVVFPQGNNEKTAAAATTTTAATATQEQQHQYFKKKKLNNLDDVPLVEFMLPIFTRTPGESYRS